MVMTTTNDTMHVGFRGSIAMHAYLGVCHFTYIAAENHCVILMETVNDMLFRFCLPHRPHPCPVSFKPQTPGSEE